MTIVWDLSRQAVYGLWQDVYNMVLFTVTKTGATTLFFKETVELNITFNTEKYPPNLAVCLENLKLFFGGVVGGLAE